MADIITPINKVKVSLKEWITGRDEVEIQRPITAIKLQIGEAGHSMGEINAGEASEKSKNIAIEKVVISVNGKTEGILDAILDMHKQDYQFVISEVDKIISGDFIKPVSQTHAGGIKSEG
jgi:hypothetical protein